MADSVGYVSGCLRVRGNYISCLMAVPMGRIVLLCRVIVDRLKTKAKIKIVVSDSTKAKCCDSFAV